jgi:lysine N6-hydroxylase
MSQQIYDIAGIGIGPFNLGLACLSHPVKNLKTIFFDKAADFNWHPGMMLDFTTLQVPFLADLVTMADPCSEFSFLNYLKQTDRIYRFYIKEDFFLLRKEYNEYCRWAVSKLPECRFNHLVHTISFIPSEKVYVIHVKNLLTDKEQVVKTRKIVLGTGTQPYVPSFIDRKKIAGVYHNAEYASIKNELLLQNSVSIIGSGQSAAEVFYDLLNSINIEEGQRLHWFTRADRMAPLEYSKLTLELTSPEYVDHFYALPAESRKSILAKQNYLYKGIDLDLINQIYELLYEKSIGRDDLPVSIHTCSELKAVSETSEGILKLDFFHTQQKLPFEHSTDSVVLCTGYQYQLPECLYSIKERIRWDKEGRLDAGRNYAIDTEGNGIYVQNAELHTHGFVTPDLGMGAYRNSVILNEIAGEEIYKTEKRIAFQKFSIPQNHQNADFIN